MSKNKGQKMSIKGEIEKYVGMPHGIHLKQDEGGFVATIPDLSGCISQGDTLEEAYKMILEAKELWIESALQDGEVIPEPSEDKKHSGRILLRIPPKLHSELTKNALQQGVSLNQYLTYLLTKENEKIEFNYYQTNRYTVNVAVSQPEYTPEALGELKRY